MSKARQDVHLDDKVVALGEEVSQPLHRHITITFAPINSTDAAFAKMREAVAALEREGIVRSRGNSLQVL